jgi:hypothetical protein
MNRRQLFTMALAAPIVGSAAPRTASHWTPGMGDAYVVGERGPELVIPKSLAVTLNAQSEKVKRDIMDALRRGMKAPRIP